MNTVANDHSFHQEDSGLSRVEYAYRKIKNNITTNSFPSGFQILEPELASKLGVSRTPVREALIRLEADNLIQLIPRRGMRVTPLNPKDVMELNEVIVCLQTAAVKSVCAPHRNANFERLEQHLSALRQNVMLDDKVSWVESEDKFFLALMSLSGNFRLKAAAENLLDQFRRAKFLALGFIGSATTYVDMHSRLLDALKRKDESAALREIVAYQTSIRGLFNEVQEKYQLKEL